ncbi:ComEC family competence protein [Flavobacteriaceae bacterium TK19130]|nr:ComEC family competence protein [Thermobacterium salinum]
MYPLSKKTDAAILPFGICTLLFFTSLGYWNYQLRLPKFSSHHYSHFTQNDSSTLSKLRIRETLKPDRYYWKYIAEVSETDKRSTTGRILLQLKKEAVSNPPEVDAILLTYAATEDIPSPMNPDQFDYSAYMRSLNVHHRMILENNFIIKHSERQTSLKGWAEKLRNRCVIALKRTDLPDDERAILQALVLGEKREVSKELYNAYAAAGAVHILAVSGLHVGMLAFGLQWLFKPIRRFRWGKVMTAVLLILLLFGYAVFTGLSPSVTRAATMFSLFMVAQQLDRPTNSMNTLFLSFFILLLINPLWLFQVGFQLSYAAVFSIVWLQPSLFRIWFPKYTILRKLWAITTVTITAQIGVLPLSLYYFHQLPLLFLLTNLVMMPILGLLMLFGILMVLLSVLNSNPPLITKYFSKFMGGINDFIRWVAGQETFLITDISFSTRIAVVSYLTLFSLMLFLQKRKASNTYAVLVGASVFIGIMIYESYTIRPARFIIFQKSRETLLAVQSDDILSLYTSNSDSLQNKYPIKSFTLKNNIKKLNQSNIPTVFKIMEKTFLVIDSTSVYPSQKIDVLILTQSPKLHLEKVIATTQPNLIIADGSNYNSYVRRWKKTCEIKRLPFYHTGTKGAFILEQ